MITERLKIWILLLVVAGCGTGTALAQKMVKVSGTVYNIAENRKVPFLSLIHISEPTRPY